MAKASRLHLNKSAIRVLGIAESFSARRTSSTLAGVVMRADLVIDGAAFGKTTVGGDDATEAVERLFRSLGRNDINLVMLAGGVLSFYNIVDVEHVVEKTGVPLICLTYKESAGLEGAIRLRFGEGSEAARRLDAYKKLGGRRKMGLKTGSGIFYRSSGVSDAETRRVLDVFTLQGGVPEPVRVAKILARAAASVKQP